MALNITGGTGTLADPYILGSPLTVNGDSILSYVQALRRYDSVYFQFAVGDHGGDWTITVDSTPDTYNLNLFARDTDTTTWTGDNAMVRVGDGDRQVSVTVQSGAGDDDDIIIDVEDERLGGQTLTACRLTLRSPMGWTGDYDGESVSVSALETVNYTVPEAAGGGGITSYATGANFPAWLTFDPTSRIVSGVVPLTGSSYSAAIVATDGFGSTSTFTLTIQVRDLLQLSPLSAGDQASAVYDFSTYRVTAAAGTITSLRNLPPGLSYTEVAGEHYIHGTVTNLGVQPAILVDFAIGRAELYLVTWRDDADGGYTRETVDLTSEPAEITEDAIPVVHARRAEPNQNAPLTSTPTVISIGQVAHDEIGNVGINGVRYSALDAPVNVGTSTKSPWVIALANGYSSGHSLSNFHAAFNESGEIQIDRIIRTFPRSYYYYARFIPPYIPPPDTSVYGTFTTRHAVQGAGSVAIRSRVDQSGSFTTRHSVRGSGTPDVVGPGLRLSHFVIPAGRAVDLLFLAEASASGSSSDGFYITSERGGSDSPSDGDDKFGTGNDGKITRLRFRSGHQVSANQAGYSSDDGSFESYVLNTDLQIHFQTDDGVASWVSTDLTSARMAGGRYADWPQIPTAARNLFNDLSSGDRFILAFSLPSTGEDTTASFTTRHAVRGSGSVTVIDTGADLSATFAARHAIQGAGAVTVTGGDLAASFTTRHAVQGSGAVAVTPQVDQSGTFTIRHAVRGAGSVAVTGGDVSATFATRHAVQGSGSAIVGYHVSGSFTTRHAVQGAGNVSLVGSDLSGSFTARHTVQGAGAVTVSVPLLLSDFRRPAGRIPDLLFLAQASAAGNDGSGFYRTTEREGSDTPIAGDDKFGTANDGKITRIWYRGNGLLVLNQAGSSLEAPEFENFVLQDGLQVHLQTEDGVASWVSTDYTNDSWAGGGFVSYHNIPTAARNLLNGLSSGGRFILAFTLPTTATIGSFATRHVIRGGATVTVTGGDLSHTFTTRHRIQGAGSVAIRAQVDSSGSFATRHAVRGAGSLTLAGFDVAAEFRTRHAVGGSGTVAIRPQVDQSASFTVRHAIRGGGSVSTARDASESFTVRHAVRGDATVVVVGANVYGSTVRHEVAGAATVDVSRGIVDISASFTIRHDVDGAARVAVIRDDYAGGSGVTVQIGGFAYPGTDAEVAIQRPLDSRAQAKFRIETTPQELAARQPQRGEEVAIEDAETGRRLFTGYVYEPQYYLYPAAERLRVEIAATGTGVRLDDTELTNEEGIAIVKLPTLRAQVFGLIGLLSREGFTVGGLLDGSPVRSDIRFHSIAQVLRRIADDNNGVIVIGQDRAVSIVERGAVTSSSLHIDGFTASHAALDIDQQNFRTHHTVTGGSVQRTESIAGDGVTQAFRLGAPGTADRSYFAPSITAGREGRFNDSGVRFRATAAAIISAASLDFFGASNATSADLYIGTTAESLMAMSLIDDHLYIRATADPGDTRRGNWVVLLKHTASGQRWALDNGARTAGVSIFDSAVRPGAGDADQIFGTAGVHFKHSGSTATDVEYVDIVKGNAELRLPPTIVEGGADGYVVRLSVGKTVARVDASILDGPDILASEDSPDGVTIELSSTAARDNTAGPHLTTGAFDNLGLALRSGTAEVSIPLGRASNYSSSDIYVWRDHPAVTQALINMLKTGTVSASLVDRSSTNIDWPGLDVLDAGRTTDLVIPVSYIEASGLRTRALEDMAFDVEVVDKSVTGAGVRNFEFDPSFDVVTVTGIAALSVNGVDQALGVETDWYFDLPSQEVRHTVTPPPASTDSIQIVYNAKWLAEADSGVLPRVDRHEDSDVTDLAVGRNIAAARVDAHGLPSEILNVDLRADLGAHVDEGSAVTIDRTLAAALGVGNPVDGEKWIVADLTINTEGFFLFYGLRLLRHSYESRFGSR